MVHHRRSVRPIGRRWPVDQRHELLGRIQSISGINYEHVPVGLGAAATIGQVPVSTAGCCCWQTRRLHVEPVVVLLQSLSALNPSAPSIPVHVHAQLHGRCTYIHAHRHSSSSRTYSRMPYHCPHQNHSSPSSTRTHQQMR